MDLIRKVIGWSAIIAMVVMGILLAAWPARSAPKCITYEKQIGWLREEAEKVEVEKIAPALLDRVMTDFNNSTGRGIDADAAYTLHVHEKNGQERWGVLFMHKGCSPGIATVNPFVLERLLGKGT